MNGRTFSPNPRKQGRGGRGEATTTITPDTLALSILNK